jgi:NADPH-dependent 2,4-dienoyl-CoA reductase/sulfur reductase-like enzyme
VNIDHLVIVGGSAAGARAAQTALSLGRAAHIDVVSSDPDAPYYRPSLSKQLLKGDWTRDKAAQPTPGGDGLTWHRGARAVEIDTARGRVVLDDGRRLPYDRLLLAGGCRPRRLPGFVPGGRLCEVTGIADVERMRAYLSGGGTALIVGAGLIGSEVASTLLALGVGVTVVDPSPTPLARALGEIGDQVCVDRHRASPLTLRLGVSVSGVGQDGSRAFVELTTGETLTADVVVACVGVTPDTGWIRASGLPVLPDGGVDCDEHLLVRGRPEIAAAGDAASWESPRAGRKVRVEHWLTAVEQGGAAVRNLLAEPGDRAPFDGLPMFWTEQHGRLVHFVGFQRPGCSWEIVEGSVAEGRLVAACPGGAAPTGYLLIGAAHRLAHYRRDLSRRTVGAGAG